MFDLSPTGDSRLVIDLLPRDEGVAIRLTDAAGDYAEAHTMLQRIDDVLRIASQPGFHEDIGRGLFRALLPGELGDRYRAAYAQATIDGVRLALDLHIDGSLVRLARYPWELLHDGTRFLLRSGMVSLVRTLDFPAPIPPYTPHGPLDILTAAPQPSGEPSLVPVGQTLDDLLTEAMRRDRVDVAQLFPGTWDALLEWLLAGGPDVLHFDGTGDFTRTGRLFFEDARGRVDAVTAHALGAVFYSTRLRLVALSASMASGELTETPLNSIAPTLIQAGIPAVIAAQATLPQADAARFWRVVYNAILVGEDVESAVAAGRHALRRTIGWHAIALYRRAVVAPDGVAIDGAAIDGAAATDAPPVLVPVRVDTAVPAQSQLGWTLRAGLWLNTARAPAPDADVVTRVIGAPLADQDADTAVTSPTTSAPLRAAVRPGPVTVLISAPGCAVHGAAERTLPFMPHSDDDPLPVWFAVTPRRTGYLALSFTLSQGGRTLATVTHPLVVHDHKHIFDTPETAQLHAHQPRRVPAADSQGAARDSRESTVDSAESVAGVRREWRDSRDRREGDAMQAARDASDRRDALSEALDGVHDTLQTGQPPDDDDDPLVRTPLPSVRRRLPVGVSDGPDEPDDDTTQLDTLPPPQRIDRVDRGAASLDALPPTDSLRALDAREVRRSPSPASPPARSPQRAQAATHDVPPFHDQQATAAAAASTGQTRRRWLLGALVLVLLAVGVVIAVLLLA